jgi:hypothetical protein
MLNFKIPTLKTTEPVDKENPGRQKRSPASSPAVPTITCLSASLGAFVVTAAETKRARRSPFGSPERKEKNKHVLQETDETVIGGRAVCRIRRVVLHAGTGNGGGGGEFRIRLITAGRGDGELPGDDEVGEQHEEEADGEADVEVALRPALETPPPGLHLAAHRLFSFFFLLLPRLLEVFSILVVKLTSDDDEVTIDGRALLCLCV